jgi:hypothetical protein
MKEVVYIVGAGLNQVVKDWEGDSPPLLNNFFQIALKKRKFKEEHYSKQIQDVYEYIEKQLRTNKKNLAELAFDLELCFTLLESQIRDAQEAGDNEEFKRLFLVHFHLVAFLAEVLSDFEVFSNSSVIMRNLGKIIFFEQPTLISFNYDCLLEPILELASGVNISVPQEYHERMRLIKEEEPSDQLLMYSHCNWNKPLAYGFKFDEVELQQAGIRQFAKGSKFYSIPQNKLYSKPLLKLHGSLNWFRYMPIRRFPTFPGEKEPKLGERATNIIMKRGTWWIGQPPDHDGWLIQPIIITPVLYKEGYYREKPFGEIWKRAGEALAKCKKLVIVGYSFSPADFSTKRLLIESLRENDLEELVIINPDHNVLKIAKELCHFCGGVTWFSNLDDYLKTFAKIVRLEREIEEIPEDKLPKDTSPHDVYTKCKSCGVTFRVGIRTNPRSFATSQFIGVIATCPNGHRNSYDKEEFVLNKGV